MAGALFRVDVKKERANSKLRRVLAATQNPTALYKNIGATILNRIRLVFATGKDPWGATWTPLKFRQGEPLRDTGRLNRSITQRADATGTTIGTNVKYAATHQFGAVIRPRTKKFLVFTLPNGVVVFAKKVTIPARPFLPIRNEGPDLPPAWRALVLRNITSYLRRIGKGAA